MMRHMPIDPGASLCAPRREPLPASRVGDRMTCLPVTVPPGRSVRDARALMRARGIRHLPVVEEGGALVGIVSERDLRGRAAADTVAAVMTSPVITLAPDADVCAAAHLFRERGIGAVAVTEHGRLVGVLTRRDVIAVLAELEPR